MAEKLIRAVGYCRTSDKSNRETASIEDQQKTIKRYIEDNGWTCVQIYVDEHLTGKKIEGRDAFEKMIRDAAKDQFEIIVVFDIKRYGRNQVDIQGTAESLKSLYQVHVVDTEGFFDSRREEKVVNAVAAALAHEDRDKTVTRLYRGKASRARAGGHPHGRLPYARTYDKKTRTWGLDYEKQARIEAAARRYVAGEPMKVVAKSVGMHANALHKVLRYKCGPTQLVKFKWDELSRLKEVNGPVPITIPALLDDDLINAVLDRMALNKTVPKGPTKHEYLLIGKVFCGVCGAALDRGMADELPRYRHGHSDKAKTCTLPVGQKPWIRRDDLEDAVVRQLLDWCGNPPAIRRAIEAAVPNLETIKAKQAECEVLRAKLAKIPLARAKRLRAFDDDLVPEDEVRADLAKLKAEEGTLLGELRDAESTLDQLVTPAQTTSAAKQMSEWAYDEFHNVVKNEPRKTVRPSTNAVLTARASLAEYFDHITWEQKRELIDYVFAGKKVDGRKPGVHVWGIDGQVGHRYKLWRYQLVGNIATADGDIRELPSNNSETRDSREPFVEDEYVPDRQDIIEPNADKDQCVAVSPYCR